MPDALPHWRVPRAPAEPSPFDYRFWDDLSPHHLRDATDGSTPRWVTRVWCAADDERLFVRFGCLDPDPWGTYQERDDPLYEEEVVELFIAPGTETPRRYAEFEVSPRGVVFDAWVDNPTGERKHMTADPDWDCPGLECRTGRLEANDGWWVILSLPWASLLNAGEEPPEVWRANFYRIERPRGAGSDDPEFSAWSPTYRVPADFHAPGRFGRLLPPVSSRSDLDPS